MKLKVLLTILLLSVCVVGGKLAYSFYWYGPQRLTLTEIARVHTSKTLRGVWWAAYGEYNPYPSADWFKLPILDLNKNDYILSAGREIKSITYTRASRYENGWEENGRTDHPYIGIAVFKRPLYPHTLFVYKI